MIPVLFAYCIAGDVRGEKIYKSTVRLLMEQPTRFSATTLSAQGSFGDEYQACSSRVLQLSNSAEILPRVASEREQEAASENTLFIRLSNVPKFYANRPQHKQGLTIELHFSVAGYAGLHLPFSGVTQYLRCLVAVYERPIFAVSEYLIVSFITVKLGTRLLHSLIYMTMGRVTVSGTYTAQGNSKYIEHKLQQYRPSQQVPPKPCFAKLQLPSITLLRACTAR